MTIKVGDKVRIIREYSVDRDKIGIVVIIPTKEADGRVFIDRYTNWYIEREQPIEQQLELVEVAHYIPVPKFHFGDVVYDTETKKQIHNFRRKRRLFALSLLVL